MAQLVSKRIKAIAKATANKRPYNLSMTIGDDELKIVITETDTLDDYIGTVSLTDLSAKHRLFADAQLVRDAISSRVGENAADDIAVEITERMEKDGHRTWVISATCEIVLRGRPIRDELIIMCNGPVSKSDAEKMASTISILRAEIALLNTRVREVEEENRKLNSHRNLGVLEMERQDTVLVDLNDGSYWTRIDYIWPIIGHQIFVVLINQCGSIVIGKIPSYMPNIDLIMFARELRTIPVCKSIAILPCVYRSPNATPESQQLTIQAEFAANIHAAIENDGIRQIAIGAEFKYLPPPGIKKISIIRAPYLPPKGFEGLLGPIQSTGGAFESKPLSNPSGQSILRR